MASEHDATFLYQQNEELIAHNMRLQIENENLRKACQEFLKEQSRMPGLFVRVAKICRAALEQTT